MTYANCGHEPAVLIRDGRVESLPVGRARARRDPSTQVWIETVSMRVRRLSAVYTTTLVDAMDFTDKSGGGTYAGGDQRFAIVRRPCDSQRPRLSPTVRRSWPGR